MLTTPAEPNSVKAPSEASRPRPGARSSAYDAVVIGSGPNGLAAAITLARRGLSVVVLEAKDTIGGGARTCELTLPGFRHDVCSAVHPLGVASPFFRTVPLEAHGVEWIHPPSPLAHPLDSSSRSEGGAALLERSIEATGATLGPDAGAYERIMAPFARRFDALLPMVLAPLRFPRAPFLLARFGLLALQSVEGLVRRNFVGERAPALLAGMAAHSMLALDSVASVSFGLVLALAGHAVGWPIPRRGSQALSDAMARYLEELGGTLQTGVHVQSFAELPPARAYLFDVTPRQLVRICGDRLPERYRARLGKFRYGPGAFKVDWALDAPIPWRAEECRRACTVHVGGTVAEIAASEAAIHEGRVAERPFVLVVQPTLFDPSRAPPGKHVAWAYCHVPHGSELDVRDRIEAQIERFAPGFRERILARSVLSPAGLERHNPNYIGGDINGGSADLGQLFTRPVAGIDPYATPAKDIFLCSSSTPPGGGVHGMCGYLAAQAALAKVFGLR